MNIQTKVTILFFFLTSMVILFLNGFIFLFANHYAFEDFYKRLETRVQIVRSIYSNKNTDSSRVVQNIRQQYLEKLPSEKEYYLPITASQQIMTSLPEELPKEFLADLRTNQKARYRQDNKFFAGTLYQSPTELTLVVVSATDPYGFQELNHLRNILILGFGISILVVYWVGKVFSYQTFKPIREMIRNVQNITAQNLHLRLETNGGKDEVNMLGQTFNDMLIRLETAFETQNNFVSNASHELRTPLTVIKGEAELALRQPHSREAQVYALEVIHRESEKLNQMLTGLLGLAQTGFDGKKQNWEAIRTDELIWQVKESVDQLYPQNRIQIDFSKLPIEEEKLTVFGNATLLKLATSNIVANACKYSYNQQVIISLQSTDKQVVIQVKDMGIGIPEQELRYVFEPFFRASNTSDFEGHGIGLPLSMNIIRLHKGNIQINTKEGKGTDMSIVLPIADSQDMKKAATQKVNTPQRS
jgi:signal transduction histidine kinase